MNHKRRILVLGSESPSRLIDGYLWDTLPTSLNVSDYDTVILNFEPLQDKEFAESIEPTTLPSWQQFARLVFSKGGEIIAIGIPTLSIGRPSVSYWPATWWLPMFPEIVSETGVEIRGVNPEFSEYFQHVKKWVFHTGPQPIHRVSTHSREYLLPIFDGANTLEIEVKPIAQTRFQMDVAFEMQLSARGSIDGSKDVLFGESGRIIWLPPPTEISTDEAIKLLLRNRYRVALEQVAPRWAQAYKLPRQCPMEAEINRIEEEIGLQVKTLTSVRESLQEVTRFQRLLYEQGEDGLEPVVRDTLRELKADVQDPQQRGHEDGRLVDPFDRNGILEIKGLTKSLQLGHVRQLDQWVRDAIAHEEWSGKGILVANTYCESPPGQREAPFPDNCVRTARQFGICLLTTTQLFLALQEHQEGKLDMKVFWDWIFNTNGVCNLPELEPILTK